MGRARSGRLEHVLVVRGDVWGVMKFTRENILLLLAVLGFVLGAASQWFDLRERVTLIERELKYLHGDVALPGRKP